MHWYVITNSILLLQKSVCYCTKVSIGPLLPSSPFCVCFTVFYILNRQIEWNESESGVYFLCFSQFQSSLSSLHKLHLTRLVITRWINLTDLSFGGKVFFMVLKSRISSCHGAILLYTVMFFSSTYITAFLWHI